MHLRSIGRQICWSNHQSMYDGGKLCVQRTHYVIANQQTQPGLCACRKILHSTKKEMNNQTKKKEIIDLKQSSVGASHVTFYPRGRAPLLSHPERSTRRCWCPQTGTRERSSLTHCCRTSGRNSWHKIWHWIPLERGWTITFSHAASVATRELSGVIRFTYPASLNAQFCPLIEPTRCCQATLPTCQGSWQSISCRHCWSRRWSRVCSPPCCAGTCCWPVYSWQTCIWTNLMTERKRGDKEVLLRILIHTMLHS